MPGELIGIDQRGSGDSTPDLRTPLENAQELAATLSHGHVIVLEYAAHQFDLFGNVDLRAVLGRFVCGAAVPETRIALPPIRFSQ
jgi:hypothetical protein